MKIVLVLLFVGIFAFSTAEKLDEESLIEALRSALSDDVDDTKRGVAGPYASDIDADGDEEAALQTIRELLAGNADADDDDADIDYESRRGFWGKVKDFFTNTIPDVFKKLFDAIKKAVTDTWNKTKKFFGDLSKRGIEGIKKGIAELEDKLSEAKKQVNKASGKAKTEAQNIVKDITNKINEAKKHLRENCGKLACTTYKQCWDTYRCKCAFIWNKKICW